MKSITPIELNNIQLGAAVEKANEALARIARDVTERGRVEKARNVTLTISIKPNVDPESGMNVPEIDWSVKWAVPGHKGMTTRAFVEDGELKVNLNDPIGKDPSQPTLFDRVGGNVTEVGK